MIIKAILKINPQAKVSVVGSDINTCEIEWLEGTTPISKGDIEAQFPAVEQDEQDKITLKASAKAKLIAGEKLTEEEADTIVL
jgi:hypothetical protein|tara:strand:- start:483 stop:731 length:249 start_codon:yes stop_codon:yes gene_type:complete